MESIRRKIVSLINVGSKIVCVASITKFLIFLNYVNLNHFRQKIIKKEKCKWPTFLQFCEEGLDKGLYGILIKLKKYIQ